MIQPSKRLYVLYHEVRPGGSPYLYVVDTAAFDKHCKLFVELGGRTDRYLLPEITFDDGHSSNYNFALPILQAYGLKAHFFITAGWTGQKQGYMGWAELRALHEAGQIIGAHGLTHALLTRCDQNDLNTELRRSRLTLEDRIGTSITKMSLPGGRFNKRVLDACKSAGYTEIFTSMPKSTEGTGEFTVGRLNIRGDMSLERIAAFFERDNRILARMGNQYRLKATARNLIGDDLYERLWAIVNRQESQSEIG